MVPATVPLHPPTKACQATTRCPTVFEPLFYSGSGVEYSMGKDRHVVMRLQSSHIPASPTDLEPEGWWTPIVMHPHHPAITKLGFSQGTDAALLFRSSTKEAWWGQNIREAWQAYHVSEALFDRHVHGGRRSCI